MKTYTGNFKPKNPRKYQGDVDNIIYRSSYELVAMRYFDTHPNVLKWASEEISIPYLSPKTKKFQRYIPDFLIQIKDTDGKVRNILIEIKPSIQTEPPKETKNKRRFLAETMTYQINTSKWNAAKKWCKDRKMEFMIITEKELGIKV